MTTFTHIAVFAFPYGTHAAPFLTVVRRLAASAPRDVKFSFFSTAKSNAFLFSGPNATKFDNIKAYNVWDGLPDGENVSGNVHEAVELFLKATPDNFKKGLKEAEAATGVKIGCLMTDTMFGFGGEMAEEMGVPWVAFWACGPISLSAHMHTNLIRSTFQTSGLTENIEQSLTFIPGMSAVQIADVQDEVLFGNREAQIALMLHSMESKLSGATAVVLECFEELDSVITIDLKSKFKKLLNVGPSTLSMPPPCKSSDETGCLLWLDKHKPASVAYIAFGTIVTPPPYELAELAEALETLRIPFLWSLGERQRHALPEGFLKRTSTIGKIVSWAPQLQVLAHVSVGIFITHCGWNSMLESISYAVPMICRPIFADQRLNSRMVQDVWKIGVKVECGVFTKSGTISAMNLILSNEKGEELRKNIGVLKERAIKAVKSNGSSAEKFKTLKDIITSSNGTWAFT